MIIINEINNSLNIFTYNSNFLSVFVDVSTPEPTIMFAAVAELSPEPSLLLLISWFFIRCHEMDYHLSFDVCIVRHSHEEHNIAHT